MVAFTTAKGLYQVANSSYVGTWDVPENSNWGVVDAALGQITTVQLNNTPVTLSAAQTQSCQIIFSSSAAPGGNLAGNVAVTFPLVSPSSTTLTGPYIIQHLCGNSSLFTVTLQTTVAGGQVIACKPGEPFDVVNDGTNFKFKNLGHIGSYWDYAGSLVPNWVTACTVPPYLNCDATTFSSATYPTLASIMGTTLPDLRGMPRYTLNQGTGRITTANCGLDGDTIFANKTSATQTLQTTNLPPYTPSGAINQIGAGYGGNGATTNGTGGSAVPLGSLPIVSAFSGSAQGGVSTPFGLVATGTVSGITMIRAG